MRFLPIVYLLIFLWGCKSDKVPSGILEAPKMKAVMWDMLRADEVAELNVQKDSSWKAMEHYTSQYSKVFQVHGVSKEQFQKSLHYYKTRPDLLKPIIDSLQSKAEKAGSTPPAK